MEELENSILDYAWGSRTALARLLGRVSPSEKPQAELWMGAHPAAPSLLAGSGISLADSIAASPTRTLGTEVAERFEGKLPFLLKVLAVDSPLSMQAHPDREQARRGHAREEEARIAVSAAARNYKDTNHKPEILCALSPFEALCGFRPSGQSLAMLETLPSKALDPVRGALRRAPGAAGLRLAFEHLMTMDAGARASVLEDVLAACRSALSSGCDCEAELRWALRLAELYPGDIGALSSLLLNHVRLEAGQAMFLPAGNVHCYLQGVGVELMASSDNVLRAGLTPKHIDIAELLAIVDFRDDAFATVPLRRIDEVETAYLTAAADFRLSLAELRAASSWTPARQGPEILLCTSGAAEARCGTQRIEMTSGTSIFVPASDGPCSFEGDATIFRATVGELV